MNFFEYSELDSELRLRAARIVANGDKPDLIVAISRGGMIAAQMLAYQMQVQQVRLLDVGREGGVTGNIDDDKEKPIVLRAPFVVEGKFSNVLVVDDICCQGRTFAWIKQHERSMFLSDGRTPVVQYFCCVLRHLKDDKDLQFWPDHYLFQCEHDKYIQFPWDHDARYDIKDSDIVDDDEIPF